MRVNLLITMIIFALIWPVTELQSGSEQNNLGGCTGTRVWVFVENNSDDNFSSLLAGRWIRA